MLIQALHQKYPLSRLPRDEECAGRWGRFWRYCDCLALRALGLDVHVVERQESIGGRAQAFEVDGYRHDAGQPLSLHLFCLMNCLSSSVNAERIARV